MATIGQVAFEAYNESKGGLTHDGKPIPPWGSLTDETGRAVRAAWEAAAYAVCGVLEEMISDRPLPTILVALAKAQRAVRDVQKTSANDHHRYAYASAESVIKEAREALHGAGLALITETWRVDFGEGGRLPRAVVSYLLVLEATGAAWRLPEHSTPVLEEKGRPMDKAEATALTYSLSYTLRGLLLMARVPKGVDADQRDDEDHAPPTFAQAVAECRTQNALREFLWRHRQTIAEEVSRETGAAIIADACERVGLTSKGRDKMIAQIWGEPTPVGSAPEEGNG